MPGTPETTTIPISLAAERAALMTMIIELICATHEAIDPDLEMNADHCLVWMAVMLGHSEGRAMTPTEIADRLCMPQASASRRLRWLLDKGAVVNIRGRYYLQPDRAANVPMLQRVTEILQRAFAVLGPFLAIKMSEHAIKVSDDADKTECSSKVAEAF